MDATNARPRRQSGVTLVELMVALVLGLLLLAAVSQVYLLNKAGFTAQSQNGLVQEAGRFALEFMARDARMAGLTGCSSRRPLNQQLPVRNYLNSTDWPFDVFGRAVYGHEANGTGTGASYAITATNPAPSGNAAAWTPALPSAGAGQLSGRVVPGSDVLVLSGIDAGGIPLVSPFTSGSQIFVAGTQDIAAGDILLVTNCQQAQVFQATSVAPASGNIVGSSSGAFTPGNFTPIAEQGPTGPFREGSEVARMRSFAYYVGRGADGTPSLFRAGLGGGAMQHEELIGGVESMQVLYGVDANEDYDVDRYVTAAGVAADEWLQVRAIRISLLLRSPDEFLPAADAASYALAGTTVQPVSDRRQRRVFTETISLRNRLL